MKNTARSSLCCALLFAVALAAGCVAESTTVQTTPVWSATVPEYGVEHSRTVNVFPFFSRNVTAYADRVEESGNWFLFISWSKTVRRQKADATRGVPAGAAPAAPETVETMTVESAEAWPLESVVEEAPTEAPPEAEAAPSEAETDAGPSLPQDDETTE